MKAIAKIWLHPEPRFEGENLSREQTEKLSEWLQSRKLGCVEISELAQKEGFEIFWMDFLSRIFSIPA